MKNKMADEETLQPVGNLTTPEAEELDEIKLLPFQKEEQMNLFAKTQRKRVAKRSFANFGITTLSLTKDTAKQMKKRKRKDDKKFVVDKVDGFTFVSAFTLNDFDEYDKNPVKQPLAPTKRKSSSNLRSISSKKRPRMVADLGISGGEDIAKPKGDFLQDVLKAENVPNESSLHYGKTENVSPLKNKSPLTKSAFVPLKKLNVSKLKSPQKQQVSDVASYKKPNQSNSSKNSGKTTTKASRHKTTRPASSNNQPKKNKQDTSDVVNVQIHGLPTSGGADRFYGCHEDSPTGLSDDEESLELDVCSVDENSSSQFINFSLEKMNKLDTSHPENKPQAKRKRKPCRVCCAYPCRIVEAKRIKSGKSQFPTFNISFTSRCQVHTPGDLIINNSSGNKVNTCIQTTSTDIKMHLDFAKRFPYRIISILSCQPALYDDDDLKPSDNLVTGNTRCNESHRMLEQKRRSELHGLYCQLADTLSISKNKASKQWILENALKEVENLKAQDALLTEEMNLEKIKNEKKRMEWEKLAGKPYVTPKESNNKGKSKSKLLELYKVFRQERKELKTMPEDSKCEQEELKSVPKESVDSSKEQERLLNDKSHYKAKLDALCGVHKRNMAESFGASVITTNDATTGYTHVKDNPPNFLFCSSSKSKNSLPMDSQVENHLKVTVVKPESIESHKIVRRSQSTSSQSLGAPIISKIDLTTESKSSAADQSESSIKYKQNQPTSLSTKSNQVQDPTAGTKIPITLLKESSTPTASSQSSDLLCSTTSMQSPSIPILVNPSTMFPTPISSKPNHSPSKPTLHSNKECVSITMVVDSEKTTFRIPKTANGLALLSKLSSLKKLSTDSRMKIAAQFPKCQPSEISTTTAGTSQVATIGPTTSGLVTTTGHVNTPVLPTQWSSAVGIIQNSTAPECKPVTQSSPVQAVNSSVAMKQPTTAKVVQKINTLPAPGSIITSETPVISFATISRPIKVPTMTTAAKIICGNAGVQIGSNVKRNSGIAVSEQMKRINHKTPRKSSFVDMTNKEPDKEFPVIPTSSSINVTLNKLGSITGNKIYNMKPLKRIQQQNHRPTKRLEHLETPHKDYQFHRNAPFPILPKHIATVTAPKRTSSVHIYPVLTQVHPAVVPPENLPEIPPDIPSDLTEASLSPLEGIQKICEPLLEGRSNDDRDQDDSGICVISDVFSLTETSKSDTAKNRDDGAERLEDRVSSR
ncbi:uncharacterized protein LOC114538224 [Dendronephthya gigantea]|uniref:uncharacterized protein LOC114538224 n=1 Tax=Dendronephthya gigantea TaxID=151771 RepID=UPI00106ADD21|nr:uncharacterized protein LOC114538224 [Dendronephthya gigantea]